MNDNEKGYPDTGSNSLFSHERNYAINNNHYDGSMLTAESKTYVKPNDTNILLGKQIQPRRLSLNSVISELSNSENLSTHSHPTSTIKIKETLKDEPQKLNEFVNDNLNLPHPAIEFPPLYFLLRKFPALLGPFQKLYTIRRNLSHPLQRRVLASNKILHKFDIFLTYGELFLVMPFVAFFVVGAVRSFVDPSVSITGHASRTPLIFAFATGMRNSFLTLLIGIPFERSLWYHKLAGRTAFATAILHTYVAFAHPVPSSITGTVPTTAWPDGGSDFVKFCLSDSVNTGGTLLFLAITIMLLTSIPYMRRKVFEVFFYIHAIFATTCLGCAFYHTGVLIPILGSLTWGVDILLRKVYMAHFRYPKQGKLRHISDTVVELSFPKTRDFDYNPGQYVRIAVPDLSIFEWHPFSLSSCPLEDSVTICIRKIGSWTNALHKLAGTKQEVSILLEGPYGSIGVDLISSTRYKMIMLLSGGIGVTPMQSICNQLVFEHATKRREIKKLRFYWMERDPTAIQDMDITRRGSSIHHTIRSLDQIDASSREIINSRNIRRDDVCDLSISQSILSDVEEGNPISVASTALSLVPPSFFSGEQLSEKYPEDEAPHQARVKDKKTEVRNRRKLVLDFFRCRLKYLQPYFPTNVEKVDGKVTATENFIRDRPGCIKVADANNGTWTGVDCQLSGGKDTKKEIYNVGREVSQKLATSETSESEELCQPRPSLALDVEQNRTEWLSSLSIFKFDKIKNRNNQVQKQMNFSGRNLIGEKLETPTGDEQETSDAQYLLSDLSELEQDDNPLYFPSKPDEQQIAQETFLQNDEDPYGVLDIELYLTEKKDEDKITSNPLIKVGRPNVDNFFVNMRAEALVRREKRVAVCICAPKQVALLCHKACLRYSDSKVRFDLHEEVF